MDKITTCTNEQARQIAATPEAERTPQDRERLALWFRVTDDLPADHYE